MCKNISSFVSTINNHLNAYRENNTIKLTTLNFNNVSKEICKSLIANNFIDIKDDQEINETIFNKYVNICIYKDKENSSFYFFVGIYKENITDSYKYLSYTNGDLAKEDIYEFHYKTKVDYEDICTTKEETDNTDNNVTEEKEEEPMDTNVNTANTTMEENINTTDNTPTNEELNTNNDIKVYTNVKKFIKPWNKLDFAIQSLINTIYNIEEIDHFTKQEINDRIDSIVNYIGDINMESDIYDNLIVHVNSSRLFVTDTDVYDVFIDIDISVVLDNTEFSMKYKTSVTIPFSFM